MSGLHHIVASEPDDRAIISRNDMTGAYNVTDGLWNVTVSAWDDTAVTTRNHIATNIRNNRAIDVQNDTTVSVRHGRTINPPNDAAISLGGDAVMNPRGDVAMTLRNDMTMILRNDMATNQRNNVAMIARNDVAMSAPNDTVMSRCDDTATRARNGAAISRRTKPTLPGPRSMLALSAAACLLLSGCGSLDRLASVGRPPEMTKTADPTKDPSWRPVNMPMPTRQAPPNEANALWRQGSRAFFKDQRAAQVGDVVTIVVNMNDTANLKNVTSAGRGSTESAGMPNLFGLESLFPKTIVDPSKLLTASSGNTNTGTGQIQRNEAVTLRLAGVVTQVLPNGNLVVAARQEFLVNSELRQLQVTGVIRPQDIASDNTVLHDRMAEARIAYGGKGQLTDLQTARWGQQVMDILMPF